MGPSCINHPSYWGTPMMTMNTFILLTKSTMSTHIPNQPKMGGLIHRAKLSRVSVEVDAPSYPAGRQLDLCRLSGGLVALSVLTELHG